MPGYFLDTSAFAKLYHQEPGSQYVLHLLDEASCKLVISSLTLIEMESVLAIKVRTGELDAGSPAIARRRLQADIAQGRIHLVPASSERHYPAARRLLMRFGASLGLRTLDAIQLAVALDLRGLDRISFLVASDQRLCRCAEANGCHAIDPANPDVVLL